MAFVLSQRSIDNLAGVHPDLERVVRRAITVSPFDFVVIEGLRTLKRQQDLFDQGATRTMKSRHLTGHAVDIGALCDGKLTWRPQAYRTLAPGLKQAAELEGVPLEWGGDWATFIDMPHWQLPWENYP